ncbi:MAG: hypothetical protein ACRD2X_01480 [Vicinamibacteraceae bacterium]
MSMRAVVRVLRIVMVALVIATPSSSCAMQGRQAVHVHGLNEGLSGPVKNPPRGLRRLVGVCDSDSYHVRIGGADHCLVLNGGLEGPLATIDVTRNEDDVLIDETAVATLRDIAARLKELTSEDSRHLVLSARNRPIALVWVTSLSARGPIRVKAFE